MIPMRKTKTVLILLTLLLTTSLLAATPSEPSSSNPDQIKSYFTSDAYTSLHRTDEQFITDVYRIILHRTPDPAGQSAWLKALQSHPDDPKTREQMIQSVLTSDEYKGQHTKPLPPALQSQKPDTTRIKANEIFDHTGMFVDNATAYTAKPNASRCKLAHVAWVSLQIDNGGQTRNDNAQALEKGWADAWRRAGFKVGFWGCPRGITKHNDPDALKQSIPLVQSDAKLAVSLCKKYHADFYLADLEDFFKGYSPTDPTPALNKIYVDTFEAAAKEANLEKMPRALSSEGRIALDMKPWINAGWDAMPQAYWNAYAVYQPSKCVDFYSETGWPVARIHPTIGTFTSEGEKRTVTLEQYDQDLKSRPIKGFSFFLPESYLKTDDQYRQLAKMSSR